MRNSLILMNLRTAAWAAVLVLGFGCDPKHQKKNKPGAEIELPFTGDQPFLDACLSSTATNGVKNLVKMVLEHPLIATQDCNTAAIKLEQLEGIAFSTSPDQDFEVDLAPLAGLENLRYFGLAYITVKDLSPIRGLTLKSIILFSNQLSDFSPLGEITSLETVLITDNPVTSIAPLAKLPKLSLFSLELKTDGPQDLGLNEASCPTESGTNPEIQAECLVRRANGPLWIRQLVGSWEEGSLENGHSLVIDETGHYKLTFHSQVNGTKSSLNESGTLEFADWIDTISMTGLRFLSESNNCNTAFSTAMSRDNQGLAGYKRDNAKLIIGFKQMIQVTFRRGASFETSEEPPCPL